MAAPCLPNFTLPFRHSFNSNSQFLHPVTLNFFKLRHTLNKHPLSCKSQTAPSLSAVPSSPSRNLISKFFVKEIAAVLLGSLIFTGVWKARPVLSQPVQETERVEEIDNSSEEEAMYAKLAEENPRDVEALKMVVNLKMKKGKTKEAMGYVERLIEVQPNEMEWRLLKALCYEMMGDFSKAKSFFKDILRQKPLLLRALHGLAMVMHKNHEGPAVFEMLERALDLARREKRVNEERNIRILITQMHLIKGDLEIASEQIQALIDDNPRDFRPYLCQGIVYILLDKKREANESFEMYRSLVPEEFPQRRFLDDVVLTAKTESRQQLQKELLSKSSRKK